MYRWSALDLKKKENELSDMLCEKYLGQSFPTIFTPALFVKSPYHPRCELFVVKIIVNQQKNRKAGAVPSNALW